MECFNTQRRNNPHRTTLSQRFPDWTLLYTKVFAAMSRILLETSTKKFFGVNEIEMELMNFKPLSEQIFLF